MVEDLIGDRSPELPPEVIRTKYFAMPLITVDEALEQLQFIDHDFYMFRNAETEEINVIYKRSHHRGYGVIQPRHGDAESNGKSTQANTEVLSSSKAAQV